MLRLTRTIGLTGAAAAATLGLLAAATPALAATSYPTTLTERAPGVVTYGAYEAVVGRLSLAGTPFGLSGERVALYDRPAGRTTWTYITTHLTNGQGSVSFSVKPLVAMQFQLRHAADSYTAASSSGAVTTKVAWRVSASLTKTSVAPKATDAIAATVAPNAKGTTVTLQRKTSTGWVSVATKTLSTTSTATFAFTAPATAGKYSYRVVKAASSVYATGVSPTLVLNVT